MNYQPRDSTQSIMANAIDEYGVSGEYTFKRDHIWTYTSNRRIFHSKDKGLRREELVLPSSAKGNLGIQADDSLNLFVTFNDFNANSFALYKKPIDSDDWIDITPSEQNGYISGFSAIPQSNVLLFNAGELGDPTSFKT
ncbi:MAG: hypothetical protein RLZZ546_614 [Bacteroidota bacterium]|jgi:hypothetical protein